MIQRFLYTTIKTGFEQLRDKPELVDDVFDQYDFSDTEIAAIKTSLTEKFPEIKHQYARMDDTFPVISIVLGNEEESDHYIGDYALQDDDGTETISSIWSHSYDCLVYSEHPDHTSYLYEMLKAILISAPLYDCGLHKTHFHGGDLPPDPRYIPAHLFVRKFTLSAEREFERIDRASRLNKAFQLRGIHIDKSGSPSDVGGVKTLVTISNEETNG